jgi:hypothetical protein
MITLDTTIVERKTGLEIRIIRGHNFTIMSSGGSEVLVTRGTLGIAFSQEWRLILLHKPDCNKIERLRYENLEQAEQAAIDCIAGLSG